MPLALLLLTSAILVLVAGTRAPTLSPIAGGRVSPEPAFLAGLYGPETHPDGYTYRWTTGAPLVQLRGAFYAAPAYLAELRLRADSPTPPQPLTLLVGGQPVATVTPATRFRTYQLLIGPGAGEDAELWLALQTPTFIAPANPRPLGVMLTDLTLRPVTHLNGIGALATALGLLALWAGLRACGLAYGEALALAGIGGLGLVAVAALPRPPVIPPLWLGALGLAAVAVAALTAHQAAARLGLAALALLVVLSGRLWPPWLSDDAFISFRYAQNLAQGNGLVYNIGERVEGYTNFLWTILAALLLRLGGDVAVWSHGAGVALGVSVVLLTYRLGERLLGPGWALVAALIVGTSQSVLLYTARGSGLETGLFTLLLLTASARYLRPMQPAGHALPAPTFPPMDAPEPRSGALATAGLLLAFAAMTRPEGVLVFGLTAMHLALTARRWRGVRALAGTFLVVFLPYFLWRLAYYGDLLPNTFYAKTGGGVSQILRGFAYAGGFALTLGGPLLLVAAVPWLQGWRAAARSWRGYVLPIVLVYTAYIIAVGGDHFRGERFFVPLIPWIALLVADGLAHIVGLVGSRRSVLGGNLLRASLALLLLCGAVGALVRTRPIDPIVQGLDESVWIWREIGWWMADHAPPGASLAAAGAGAPAFYGQRETIDLYGLTDRHIGRLEVADMGTGVAGHEKRDPAYVLNTRQVTYIPRIWEAYFGGPQALRAQYELITVTTRSGRTLELWERQGRTLE